MYTPIIRNRQSEILAIQALTPAAKADCIPLLDLAAPAKKADQASAQAYTERNLHRMSKAIKGFERVLVDSSELDPALRVNGNKHPLLEAARVALAAGCLPIPVTGLHRDQSHMKAALKIKSITKQNGPLCFRLDATDVATASLTYRQLLGVLSGASLASTDAILLIDLQSVYGQDAKSITAQVSRLLSQIRKSEWAALIVAGYGIPDLLSDAIAVRGQGYIPRIEQDIFQRVAAGHTVENLWFGDYTTLSPTHVELDWRLMSKVMSPKAVYTLTDTWFVVRGGPFSSHQDGYGQYHDLAAEIVALEEFSGADYSYGDKYIDDCANKVTSTGSPGSWITACVNRHITLSAEAHHT